MANTHAITTYQTLIDRRQTKHIGTVHCSRFMNIRFDCDNLQTWVILIGSQGFPIAHYHVQKTLHPYWIVNLKQKIQDFSKERRLIPVQAFCICRSICE
jgi:hypothetical protein